MLEYVFNDCVKIEHIKYEADEAIWQFLLWKSNINLVI